METKCFTPSVVYDMTWPAETVYATPRVSVCLEPSTLYTDTDPEIALLTS